MSGPDLSALSTNWKKLQGQLQTTKNKKPQQNGDVKRKGLVEKSRATSKGGIKKTRSSANKPADRRRMGGYLSTHTTPTLADRASALITEHDIDPSAIPAAYGSNANTTRTHTDDINGGLHPTHKAGKYVALDCEMVGTGPPPHADNVLARASLVNFHGEQIYDSYVQAPPGIKVEDYRGFVSGIKPHHMRPGYARPFAEVQREVARLLDGRILVGHALRNDLNALVLSHPKRDLRDTSRHPKFRVESRGKPPALRKLALSELGIEIQTGEHSSVEDARAAMMLFKKEKVGFDEENRKHFGARRRVEPEKNATKGRNGTSSVDEEEEDEAEDDDGDLDLLDGEDGDDLGEDEILAQARTAQQKIKKRKKKKRTKR